MKNVCVVTGGGSGMGLESAKLIGKDHMIILSGRTVSKLETAINELKSLGIEAVPFACDVSDRDSVKKLSEFAVSCGNVKTVVHSAGVSPHMTDGEKIFAINAIGTINVNEIFAEIMGENSCILNVASMSAYMVPDSQVPEQMFQLSLIDINSFNGAIGQMLSNIPDAQKTGLAYTFSKRFVVWYTAKMAVKYGRKGIRVVSISPGTFRTPMGEIEGEQAASFALNGALGRMGEPEEIAKMMAFMVSEGGSYLTGVDILYDGGTIAAFREMMAQKNPQ